MVDGTCWFLFVLYHGFLPTENDIIKDEAKLRRFCDSNHVSWIP